MKGEKIHSVLISGLRWGYIVLGAFYLDVATAGAHLSPSLSLPLFISAILIFLCIFMYECLCVTRINVFIF